MACFLPLSNASSFVILYIVTCVYFSGVMTAFLLYLGRFSLGIEAGINTYLSPTFAVEISSENLLGGFSSAFQVLYSEFKCSEFNPPTFVQDTNALGPHHCPGKKKEQKEEAEKHLRLQDQLHSAVTISALWGIDWMYLSTVSAFEFCSVELMRAPSSGSESPSGLLNDDSLSVEPIADLDLFFERLYSYYYSRFGLARCADRMGCSKCKFALSVPLFGELQHIFMLAAPVFVLIMSMVVFYALLVYFATSMDVPTVAAHQVMIQLYFMCEVWAECLARMVNHLCLSCYMEQSEVCQRVIVVLSS
ncbi:hypothetical protein POM88_038226 [Heracleum sosnowskyi]|uniref:Uncharacterized protein n=1 Tax=Heracleum sosnowskyi TaxID=360622 RepID=A0AAD8HSX6_9APIA|nr:hypothetical protein POM88_038226 [Heracleum sosnowskyi]